MLGALIGGALALGGSLLSSKSSKKAATKAADTSMQVANQNNALARDFYDQNQQTLNPFVQRGNMAGGALNSMLGLGGFGGNPHAGQMANGGTPMQPQAINAPQSGGDPFRQYIANSDYAFQFGEGANRINSGYAGAGTLQSGAAMKAMEDYRQNLQSGYRGRFEDLLSNQQGMGLQAAGAQAGVGLNYLGQVSQNNNNAGTAAANAALAKGANSPWNSLAMLGGTILGRSM